MVKRSLFLTLPMSALFLAACEGGSTATPAEFAECSAEDGKPFEMVDSNGKATVMCQFESGRQVEVDEI